MSARTNPRKTRRILGIFWSTAIASEMEYRLNFVLAVLAASGNLAGSLLGLYLIFGAGESFGGWTWNEALVVMAMFTLLEGLTDTLLVPNLGRIVRHVQEGTLDFLLLKPIDTQLWLSTRFISPWGLPDLVLGLGLLVYASSQLSIDPIDGLASLIPVAAALLCLYSLWFLLATTSIWFVKVSNLTEVLRSVNAAGRYPMSAYPAAFRVFFTFVVPVAFMTTVPAETLLGRGSVGWVLGGVAIALTFFAASRRFFRFAMRFYTSASS